MLPIYASPKDAIAMAITIARREDAESLGIIFNDSTSILAFQTLIGRIQTILTVVRIRIM